jgi:hypothetical protein
LLALAIDGFEFGVADAVGDGAEGGARLDRLKLFGIADENEFGAGPRHRFDEQSHLPRRHHAGLVQHEHGLVVELVAASAPASSQDDKRARDDAGFLLQSLRRLAGKRTTDDTIAGRFPSSRAAFIIVVLPAPARPMMAAIRSLPATWAIAVLLLIRQTE